jgi:alanyl-tRNA synthetase
MTTEDSVVDTLSEGFNGSILVKETPFYATMGGQCGDTGVIETPTGRFVVKDTVKVVGGKIAHIGVVESGEFKTGETVTLTVDEERRALTCNNHSATHLLQKALKLVLGGHVEQAGSYVSKDRLRFDFTHNQALSKDELARVEEIVNQEIANDIAVNTDIMTLEEAKKTGAMALFGEKYGDTVRVVTMGDFSKELCGGTHVKNTGVISTFKIISEQGVAAGVRRIEALTAKGAFAYYKNLEDELNQAAAAAKTEPAHLTEKIESMLAEIKALSSENQKLKDKMAKEAAGDALSAAVAVGEFKALPVSVRDTDMNSLRTLGDDLKVKLGEGVVILASDCGDKVNLIVMATDGAVKAGAHAGNIVKKIAPMVGGGGGGRPNMAQAGGKNPAGIADALAAGIEEINAQLS